MSLFSLLPTLAFKEPIELGRCYDVPVEHGPGCLPESKRLIPGSLTAGMGDFWPLHLRFQFLSETMK